MSNIFAKALVLLYGTMQHLHPGHIQMQQQQHSSESVALPCTLKQGWSLCIRCTTAAVCARPDKVELREAAGQHVQTNNCLT